MSFFLTDKFTASDSNTHFTIKNRETNTLSPRRLLVFIVVSFQQPEEGSEVVAWPPSACVRERGRAAAFLFTVEPTKYLLIRPKIMSQGQA